MDTIVNIQTKKHIHGFIIEFKNISDTVWKKFNNKVYITKDSAIDAFNKIRHSNQKEKYSKFIFRILPVYKMDISQHREYVLNLIEGEDKKIDNFVGWVIEAVDKLYPIPQFKFNYTNKFYKTKEISNESFNRIKKDKQNAYSYYDWDIHPIYKMENTYGHVIKFVDVLSDLKLKILKAKEDIKIYTKTFTKNTIFVIDNNSIFIIKDKKTKVVELSYEYTTRKVLDYILKNKFLEVIDIKNVEWIKPHLPIKIKNIINNESF